jgi:anti-sigma factor RsiW
MCNQREKLIGYVYDECEPAERAAVQGHLETCAECRTEIAALRSVRADLQSWQVPDTDYVSVWRPFTPAPAPSWWQQVPRWAMAAAAGVVMVSGAAGGAASYMVLNQPVQASQPGVLQPVSAVTVNDVNALEQRLRTLIKVEVDRLNSQVQLVSSRPMMQMSADQEAAFHTAFDKQLAELRVASERQRDVINGIYVNLGQIQKGFDARHAVVTTRVANLASALEQGR